MAPFTKSMLPLVMFWVVVSGVAGLQAGVAAAQFRFEEPDTGGHQQPVDAEVVDGFRPPNSFAGPGNRGLEFGLAGSTPVVNTAAGTVSFAGQVGGSMFVTVDHGDGLRTTHAFVEQVLVRRGDVLAAGATVAIAGPGYHFTAREGTTYIDPTGLFGDGSGGSASASASAGEQAAQAGAGPVLVEVEVQVDTGTAVLVPVPGD